MSKKLLTALVVGLSLAGAAVSAPAMAATDATQEISPADQIILDQIQADVEALIVQFSADPVALEAAVKNLIVNSPTPLLASQAALTAFSNPKNPAAAAALEANAGLKAAGGKGIGAAIATIGVNNPTLADAMLAVVVAFGDTDLQSAVSAGQETASLEIGGGQNDESSDVNDTETPENAASDS